MRKNDHVSVISIETRKVNEKALDFVSALIPMLPFVRSEHSSLFSSMSTDSDKSRMHSNVRFAKELTLGLPEALFESLANCEHSDLATQDPYAYPFHCSMWVLCTRPPHWRNVSRIPGSTDLARTRESKTRKILILKYEPGEDFQSQNRISCYRGIFIVLHGFHEKKGTIQWRTRAETSVYFLQTDKNIFPVYPSYFLQAF